MSLYKLNKLLQDYIMLPTIIKNVTIVTQGNSEKSTFVNVELIENEENNDKILLT